MTKLCWLACSTSRMATLNSYEVGHRSSLFRVLHNNSPNFRPYHRKPSTVVYNKKRTHSNITTITFFFFWWMYLKFCLWIVWRYHITYMRFRRGEYLQTRGFFFSTYIRSSRLRIKDLYQKQGTIIVEYRSSHLMIIICDLYFWHKGKL